MLGTMSDTRPPTLTLVTGNPGKLEETRRILASAFPEHGFLLDHVDVDLPEIQSLDLEEVLLAKGREARQHLRATHGDVPLVVEETGLELAAWNGFPGPLVKWMLHAVGPEGIARTAHALGEPGAVARCCLLLLDGEREVIGLGHTTGRLVSPPRGDDGFGWDPVFQPDGHDLTYAELGTAIKDEIGHRGRAWRDLVAKLG